MSRPKDAAAVILLRNPEDPYIFWVRRAEQLQYLGGFHAYPGGQRDSADALLEIDDCPSEDERAMRVCAIRELFEETGVLLAQGADWLTAEERAGMRRTVLANEKSFAAIVSSHGVRLDASLLVECGRWVTPPFSPRRFDTWFFLAWLPEGQEPDVQVGELEFGEWIRPADALERWRKGEVLMVPPTIHALRILAHGIHDLPVRMTALPQARREPVRQIEVKPGIILFPVRTDTLPPATHTNCYVIGGRELVVIDPASPYEDEIAALDELLFELERAGQHVREIILTHHHKDHTGGVNYLRERLGVPVAAHRLTAERLKDQITIDRFIEDNELIELPGPPSDEGAAGWRLRALHTPGHARGHLCFFEENTRSLISGDNVVGIGTVLIDPPEGNMIDYLASLDRMRELPATVLFGAHGPPIGGPRHKIDQYIKHRRVRESAILRAVEKGAGTPTEIVKIVYTDVPESIHWAAERSVVAHLEKLVVEGAVAINGGNYSAV